MPETAITNHSPAELTKELYTFLILSTVAGMVYGSYYGIFLYQQTFDLRILLIDSMVLGISTWTGYILGTFWIHRSGYVKAMRLSFLISLITSLLTILLIDQIRTVFVLLSILRGFPVGIYMAVLGSYLLKEVGKHDRNNFYYLNMSFSLAASIVLPLMLGAIVAYFGGFKVVFGLAALLFGAGLIVPMRYNKRPESEISLRGTIGIARQPYFKEFSLNRIMVDGADQLNVFLLAIVPYLIIKSVFGVGILASATAVVAAIVALVARQFKLNRQLKLGYVGGLGRIAGNLFLVIFWSTIGLAIRNLTVQLFSIFTDPISNRINIENAEQLLGRSLNRRALEMDLIEATLTLFGQIFALGAFLIVLSLIRDQNIAVLKLILVVYALWKLLNYAWIQRIHQKLAEPTVEGDLLTSQPSNITEA